MDRYDAETTIGKVRDSWSVSTDMLLSMTRDELAADLEMFPVEGVDIITLETALWRRLTDMRWAE